MKYTKSNLCQIPELGLSCIGCCGGELAEKERVLEDIKKNTLELSTFSNLKDFINRCPPEQLRDSKICRNITFIGFDKKSRNVLIGCPAHPDFSGDTSDDRENHCDVVHLCKITQAFNCWDEKKKRAFFSFLEKEVKTGLDWYEYSIKMDNDALLIEFENHYAKINRSILNKIKLVSD